jgi:MSHA biogenesis protein MshJ
MKQYWQQTVLKIDALTLRERVVIFAMVAILLIVLMNAMLIDPQFAKQKRLSSQVQAEQEKISLIQTEIRQAVRAQSDPDAAGRERLKALRHEAGQMQTALLDMQKGLVSPDKMTVLLEDIMRRDGRLRMLSLKTLPVSTLAASISADGNTVDKTAAAASAAKNKADGASATGSVYTHGVEIVVQGGYLEMLDYVTRLENMPWQLFWGKAKLNVEEYPKASLTLTLFTLSLDKKWLNL